MDVWKSEILKAVDNRGGTASYDNIFDDLREFEQSRDRTKYGRKQINLHLRQLLNFGDIIEVSDKLYSLTEKGKRRINRNDFKWVNYAGEDIIECDI